MILLSQYKTNFDVQDHRVYSDCLYFYFYNSGPCAWLFTIHESKNRPNLEFPTEPNPNRTWKKYSVNRTEPDFNRTESGSQTRASDRARLIARVWSDNKKFEIFF